MSTAIHHPKKYHSILVLLMLASSAAAAAEPTEAGPSAPANPELEKVNVENIKQKYWARGDESELGVVQNRLYSKENKFELGLFGGALTTDPFLNVQSTGASLGYHLSEYFSVHAFGWKSYVNPSGAFTSFQEGIVAVQGGVRPIPDTNFPKAYYGGEVSGSLLYGKLSVVGKSIIYFDFHLLGGAGITDTESGKNFTPHVGVGQQVFLNKFTCLRIDYRLMRYQEQLINKASGTNELGAFRTNWTNSITLGVSFLLGGGK